MSDVTVLKSRLTDAENQYHLLVSGQAAKVFVDQNGERVEYVAANAARLGQYIEELKRRIAACSGTSKPSGPMNIWM